MIIALFDLQVWAMILLPHGEFVLSHIDRVAFMCILYGYDDRESYGLNAGGIYARTGLQLVSTRLALNTVVCNVM